MRSLAARGARPRLHLAPPEGNRAGRSLSGRPPPQRVRARRAVQLLAGALAARRAPVGGALRSDARDPRAHRSRARVARVRGDPARRRRAHQLRGASQALVLLDQERRSARLRAGRNRDDRPRRAVSPPGDAEAEARRLRRPAPAHAAHRAHARGDPAAGREPRSQPHAGDHEPRAPRPRRRRSAAAADVGRRGAGAVGRRAALGTLRTSHRQAGSPGGRTRAGGRRFGRATDRRRRIC